MQENKKRNFTDLISGAVIMALAGFFYWTTFGTKSFLGTGRGRTAPDTIPKIVAVAMFVIGFVIVVQWFLAMRRGKLEPKAHDDDVEDCAGMSEKQVATRHLF